jgi:hypothetical protein
MKIKKEKLPNLFQMQSKERLDFVCILFIFSFNSLISFSHSLIQPNSKLDQKTKFFFSNFIFQSTKRYKLLNRKIIT